MTQTLTPEDVRRAIKDVVDDIIADFQHRPDTDRGTVIRRLDEECDAIFGQLVKQERIDCYDVDDLIATAQSCAVIIQVAADDAWIADDSGLWDGLPAYSVLASIAFYSLHHCLDQALQDRGYDTNDDYPFAVEDADASGTEGNDQT